MPDAHKNFAFTYVVTPPSPADSGTSMTVTSGSAALFPATPFNATVWPSGQRPLATNAEIVRVTNIAGDTLTITRAQESTTTRSILAGDQISATITAKALEDVEGDVSTLQASVSVLEGSIDVLGTTALRNPNPTLEGYTQTKAEVIPYTAIAVGSIGTVNVTLPANIFAATYSGSGTLYYSNNTPTPGTRTRLKIAADSSERRVVIPQTWSFVRNSLIDSLSVPANGTLATLVEYTGARWEIYGDPAPTVGSGSYVLSPYPVPAIQSCRITFDPKAVCDGAVDRLFIMKVGGEAPNGINILAWRLSFEADPTTELDANAKLKRASSVIGVTGAADMDVLQTTNGVASESTPVNINAGAAVANGQYIYIEFGTAYTETGHQILFEMEYSIA